jgi:hypothetical protein
MGDALQSFQIEVCRYQSGTIGGQLICHNLAKAAGRTRDNTGVVCELIHFHESGDTHEYQRIVTVLQRLWLSAPDQACAYSNSLRTIPGVFAWHG